MRFGRFASIPLTVLIAVLGACGNALASGPSPTTTVIVRLFDNFGVAAADLTVALDEARAIFVHADVDIVWRDCSRLAAPHTPACREVPSPNEVLLRLATSPAAPAARERVSLGSSLVDLEGARGVLATVFPDRVQLIARAAGVDGRVVLGRVVAHEIGHLLLGVGTHAERGLMRGFWSRQSLQRGAPDNWQFSTPESASMRSGLLARLLTQDGRQLADGAAHCAGVPELSSPPCDGSSAGISTGSSALR